MIGVRLVTVLRIFTLVLAGFSLVACQEGRPFQASSHAKAPAPVWTAKNTPYPIPVPKTKPKPPKQYAQKAAVKPKTKAQIPAGQRVIVRKGDTLYALARRHGVTVREIIRHNSLKPPYLLKPGQKLSLPKGQTHIVAKGDTAYGISRRYNMDMTQLARLNNLKRPYRLSIGQKLSVSSEVKGSTPQRVNVVPPPRSGKGFQWPIKGRVISRFGPKAGGYHNDGINIQAPKGTSVRAAESGVVVHADNKLRGYGNLVLIKHQNGWITAYAHNSQLLVRKGQKVTRGQRIAKVGNTGRVKTPQLHFEMRKGSRAVNPQLYIKG